MAYLPLPITPTAQFDLVALSQVNQLFADVHVMMRLPVPTIEGLEGSGCNLAAAITLFEIAGGVSRILSNDPHGDTRSGRLFKDFFRDYYPWNEEPANAVQGLQAVTGATAADAMYESYRNPLAHRLGTVANVIGRIKIAKSALTEAQVSNWESLTNRPPGEPPTLGDDAANARQVLHVPLLYWGLRKAVVTAVTQVAARMAAPTQTPTIHAQINTQYVPTLTTIGSMAILPPGIRIP